MLSTRSETDACVWSETLRFPPLSCLKPISEFSDPSTLPAPREILLDDVGLFAPLSPGSPSQPLEAAPAPAPGEAGFSPMSWDSGEPAPLLKLPAAQSSRLSWPVVLFLRHTFLRPFPPTLCWRRCLGQPRDTHGSVSQIQPAGIWLLREGASSSVAIPLNRRPEGVRRSRRRPREK